ncbi:J domain-containing protein [Nanoarchaeota archaeon]
MKPSETDDLYARLGVGKDASSDELRKAYRSMATKWHPDKNQDDLEMANLEFIAVTEAYNVLSGNGGYFESSNGTNYKSNKEMEGMMNSMIFESFSMFFSDEYRNSSEYFEMRAKFKNGNASLVDIIKTLDQELDKSFNFGFHYSNNPEFENDLKERREATNEAEKGYKRMMYSQLVVFGGFLLGTAAEQILKNNGNESNIVENLDRYGVYAGAVIALPMLVTGIYKCVINVKKMFKPLKF